MQKLFLVLVWLIPQITFAQNGDQYILPKYGQMSIDINEAKNLVSAGLLYGYGLSKHFSIEAELNSGIEGGQYSKRDAVGNIAETGEYQIQTLAGYAVLRKSLWNSSYVKGKLGLLYEMVERSTDQNQTLTDTSFGIAGGVGFGMLVFRRLTLEIEATQIDRNIAFFSLGTHLKF